MIKGKDIADMLEAIRNDFPKRRDGWDGPDLSLEIANHENGEFAFYMDNADKFSASELAMRNFDGENWEALVVEWLNFAEQAACVGRLVCEKRIDAADQALMDNWLKGMMTAVAESGVGFPNPELAEVSLKWNEKGEFPSDPAAKIGLAHEFLDIVDKAGDADMILTEDPEGERQFFHGFSFRQKEPGGKVAVSRVWFAFTDQNGIAAVDSEALGRISEREFRKNPLCLFRRKNAASPAMSQRRR